MDTTAIIVMGMILNHSCPPFKLIILLCNDTNTIIFYNNLDMHSTYAYLIIDNLRNDVSIVKSLIISYV